MGLSDFLVGVVPHLYALENTLVGVDQSVDDQQNDDPGGVAKSKVAKGVETLELCIPMYLLDETGTSLRPRSYNKEEMDVWHRMYVFFYDVLSHCITINERPAHRHTKDRNNDRPIAVPAVVPFLIPHKNEEGDVVAISIRAVFQGPSVFMPSKVIPALISNNSAGARIHAETQKRTRGTRPTPNAELMRVPVGARPVEYTTADQLYEYAKMYTGNPLIRYDDVSGDMSDPLSPMNIANILCPRAAIAIATRAKAVGPSVSVNGYECISSHVEAALLVEPPESYLAKAAAGSYFDKRLQALLGGARNNKKVDKDNVVQISDIDLINPLEGRVVVLSTAHNFAAGTEMFRMKPAMFKTVEEISTADLPFFTSNKAAAFDATIKRFRLVRSIINKGLTCAGGVAVAVEEARTRISGGYDRDEVVLHGECAEVAALFCDHEDGNANRTMRKHIKMQEDDRVSGVPSIDEACEAIAKLLGEIRKDDTKEVFKQLWPDDTENNSSGGAISFDDDLATVVDAYTARLQGLFRLKTGPISMGHQRLIKDSEERGNQQFCFKSKYANNKNLACFGNLLTSKTRELEDGLKLAGNAAVFMQSLLGLLSVYNRVETHRWHILFVGPPGCGKSDTIIKLNEVVDGKMYTYKTIKSDAVSGVALDNPRDKIRFNVNTDTAICKEEMGKAELSEDAQDVEVLKSAMCSKFMIAMRLSRDQETGKFVQDESKNEVRANIVGATNMTEGQIAPPLVDRFNIVKLSTDIHKKNAIADAQRSCNRAGGKMEQARRDFIDYWNRVRYIRCIIGLLQQATIMPRADTTICEYVVEAIANSKNEAITGLNVVRKRNRVEMLATEAMYLHVIATAFDVPAGTQLPSENVDFEAVSRLASQLFVTLEHAVYAITSLEDSLVEKNLKIIINELQKAFDFKAELVRKEQQIDALGYITIKMPKGVSEASSNEIDGRYTVAGGVTDQVINKISNYLFNRLNGTCHSAGEIRRCMSQLFHCQNQKESLETPGYTSGNDNKKRRLNTPENIKLIAVSEIDAESKFTTYSVRFNTHFFKQNFLQYDPLMEEVTRVVAETWEGTARNLDIVTGRMKEDSMCLLKTITAADINKARKTSKQLMVNDEPVVSMRGSFYRKGKTPSNRVIIPVKNVTRHVWMSWIILNKIPVIYDTTPKQVIAAEKTPEREILMEDDDDPYGDNNVDMSAAISAMDELEVTAPPPLLPANPDKVMEWLYMLRPPDEYIGREAHATVHYPNDLRSLTHSGQRKKDQIDAENAQRDYANTQGDLDIAMGHQTRQPMVSAY